MRELRERRWPGAIAIAAAATLAACDTSGTAGGGATGEGLDVLVESNAPFARAEDLRPRLDSTIDAALEYWGGTRQDLDGYTLLLVDRPSVCGLENALGCVQGRRIEVTTQDPGTGTVACVEQTVLVHEIGHLVIGDPNHEDPRWMEMDSVAAALSGRPGYGDGAAAPCLTYPSVWRHPLATP